MPTYEEARAEYCRAMGNELGNAYHLLWNQCALLHMRWEEYVEMFGKSQAEFDIMNAVAAGFFKSAQDTLWETILLHLCRFTDPEIVARRRTLSLDALCKMSQSRGVPKLKSLVDEAGSKTKFSRDWRNRSIAHADLERNLNRASTPLEPASRVQVRDALLSIVAVLDAIEFHFTGSTLYFGGTGWNWGGTHLINELRLILLLRKERDARINSGDPSLDDLNHKKWH